MVNVGSRKKAPGADDPGVVYEEMGPKFHKTLFADARHKALYGGRGSGKSWSVATYLVASAAQKPLRIVCARQFQNSIRDSSKELIENRISHLRLSNQFHVTDRYIFHKNDSQFVFVGLERNPENLKSLEGADIVWVEEARTISAKSMEILLPTVRKAGSQLIWTWNPVESTDPVDAYFRAGKPPPRSIVTRVDYTDNNFFYKTEMPQEMELLKAGNYERYKHVWLGDYDTRSESKVFPNCKVGRIDVPPTIPPLYGMDLGFSKDPAVVIKCYLLHETRQLYVAAENSGRIAMERLPTLIRTVINSDDDVIRCDSSQPQTIEFLQQRGLNVIPAKKGPGSVKAGINYLQGLTIWIDPSCEGMREEARLYSWMTERLTGRVLNMPVDAHNHHWDALRYAIENEIENPGLEPGDPGVLEMKLW